MNRFTLAAVATIAGASAATAGGLDRSGQKIGALFEEGNYAELSFGYVKPSVDGTDAMPGFLSAGGPAANPSFGSGTGDVADSFVAAGAAIKTQYNDAISFAIIVDEPYGSDISYPASGNTVDSLVFGPALQVEGSALGGTEATVSSYAITALGRYEFGNGFSAHGGIRYQEIEADVRLGGLGYGGLNGYRGEFESDGAFGYVVGVAYEKPEIALRVALTYNSKIDHELRTTETLSGQTVTAGASTTDVRAPESLNLDFQTGVAPDTLVFGSVRFAHYSETIVSPAFFDSQVGLLTQGDSLTDIENSIDLEIGVGRKFTDRFSGSIAFGYSTKGDDDLVSPLAPTNGARSVALGGAYAISDAVTLSGGIRYTKLGDARPETGTPDTARASFEDNSAVSVGLKVGYSF